MKNQCRHPTRSEYAAKVLAIYQGVVWEEIGKVCITSFVGFFKFLFAFQIFVKSSSWTFISGEQLAFRSRMI